MLLLHQTGSVKVGEVVRYTVTYTPGQDRILPLPSHLYVKIKNTAAIPLRAAYLHGPYTLYVACYPSTFDPYQKHERVKEEGAPEFEPQLKAGGQWSAKLTIPDEVRRDAQHGNDGHGAAGRGEQKSFTWIVEVASQVIFSKTASVHYEVLVGRDEKSVDLGFHGAIGSGHGAPGRLEDHQQSRSRNAAYPKGVFSKAVKLVTDDTQSLWNKPPFPEWDEDGQVKGEEGPRLGDKRDIGAKVDKKQRKQKKIHLVLLTHGLHSNLGADMLYMKESIDTAAKQAREDARRRRSERRARRVTASNQFGRDAIDQKSKSAPDVAITGTEEDAYETSDEEEEEVYVRGFHGNAVKTERGIQYLGKRFAKYVLSITYPDQPYLPVKSSLGKSLSESLATSKPTPEDGAQPAHKNSSIIKDENHRNHNLPYKISSISFVGHSLGGLIQTYAIAYIQKHSPDFFDLIKPVNFVAMASPFLGLSNENPVYVKFALDFGLVGRTGQDLGLTWRPPTLAKSGWGAVIGGLTNEAQKGLREPDPGAKPLLRILPTGPAHVALQKFRNRTVYSNVVNDGIVPLRTSCLLFLDWRGLGRVEKARRESGLVGTMVGWGWAEMTGQNATAPRKPLTWNDLFSDSGDDVSNAGKSSPDPQSSVPQAEASQGFDYDERAEPDEGQFLAEKATSLSSEHGTGGASSTFSAPNLWTELLNFFKPHAGHHRPEPKSPRKTQKIYRRGQTMHHHPAPSEDTSQEGSGECNDNDGCDGQKGLVRGSSLYTNSTEIGDVEAPPRTTFFESAGDVLSPPLPPRDFLIDPRARPRTIWHDRVYHPQDIPPPPAKRQRTFMVRRSSSCDGSQPSLFSPTTPTDPHRPPSSQSSTSSQTVGTMKIEEKIARAYHKDLSWRKVLVRLEPDAHNNMIVRRMFANAYGWPVVKHVCDTHFAYTAAAQTRDEDEKTTDRARSSHMGVAAGGEQVKGQTDMPAEEAEEEIRKRKHGETDGPPWPRSADDVVLTAVRPQEIDGVHDELQGLHTQWKVQDGVRQRNSRTESEIRESRDDISELVSRVSVTGESSNATSYSSMNSGRAALARLARQDSARWSDHFFEGSDDGEDEEDDDSVLLEEWRKARHRGELDKLNDNFDGAGGLEARIANSLSSSPRNTKLNPTKEKAGPSTPGPDKHMITSPETPLSAEPAELEPLSHSSGTNTPRAEPGIELGPGSITSLSTDGGLGLFLGENIEDRQSREIRRGRLGSSVHASAGVRRESLHVAEQVVLVQSKKEKQRERDRSAS
ncbi:uncharacterized protein Z518_08569 [Rhinocladiella mackenziei CBS 650.93]|uniref:Rhinocladiella mackenziei CBS 650.93 unplaced genomic scaffold supercont1.6, whole genome shotgun sequence n=1 Tax=Rhinocladiella mackenziei CBS 650.93 TaxID=1442369 RepID=A0A0D2FL03_9EURO|nr:uncharacterized protein Z518_08569 [Rhinocladiella mackenziei CBS 650.93]KIX02627.1 hypothetical protein Z518_08569 [Rhinocladiella mackenziei CBS 650.93]